MSLRAEEGSAPSARVLSTACPNQTEARTDLTYGGPSKAWPRIPLCSSLKPVHVHVSRCWLSAGSPSSA